MSDQAVNIVDHDPGWSGRFAEQQARLSVLLRPWLAAPVEHIGSTAVPGLPAKAVIDILALVHTLDKCSEMVPLLEADDWLCWTDDPFRYYRYWFLRPRPDARTHHLQVIEQGDPHAVALLAFRDALRAESALAREYAELKMRLARMHHGNRNAYTNAKTGFVEGALRSIGVTPPPRDRLPE
jgi:GrpB-like predicted nucleotidyltransferase (UPF0157 family)